jgi:hypothetical protein
MPPLLDPNDLASPRLLPLSFEAAGDRVRLVALSETQYRAASFLDERLLAEVGQGEWVAFEAIEAASARMHAESDFIFHIGHVGSTLLSRLLALSDRVFSVREPAALRTLAALLADQGAEPIERRLATLTKLWARTWRPNQKTLLKATSFANQTAPLLMALSPSARAILMFAPPLAYMAGILGGEGSPVEMRALAPSRLDRLHRQLGGVFWRLGDMRAGELAAMSWACEIAGLAQVAAAFPDRTRWLDFEDYLDHPREGLTAALKHLQGDARAEDVTTMLGAPETGRYSKAQEHAYDARLRRHVAAQSLLDHRSEIDRGVTWLNAAGNNHPLLAQAMRLAAAAPKLT